MRTGSSDQDSGIVRVQQFLETRRRPRNPPLLQTSSTASSRFVSVEVERIFGLLLQVQIFLRMRAMSSNSSNSASASNNATLPYESSSAVPTALGIPIVAAANHEILPPFLRGGGDASSFGKGFALEKASGAKTWWDPIMSRRQDETGLPSFHELSRTPPKPHGGAERPWLREPTSSLRTRTGDRARETNWARGRPLVLKGGSGLLAHPKCLFHRG